MLRLLHPAVLLMTALTVGAYSYPALRMTSTMIERVALAIPFLAVWAVPVIYWFGRRERQSWGDQALHVLSFLSMGWLNFMFILLILLDLIYLVADWQERQWLTTFLDHYRGGLVSTSATIAVIFGMGRAAAGPVLNHVTIEMQGLPKDLNGLRIVQISDLHVGPTVRQSYVAKLVAQTNALSPDLIVLTGDMVDGSVSDLAPHVAPLGHLKARYEPFLCLGNHDYYSGADAWTRHFESLGMRVLRNQFCMMGVGTAKILLAGVTDPAARMFHDPRLPDPEVAMHTSYDGKIHDISLANLRILLAHNPKLAPLGAKAGFDLQLSGHTHGGQFVPWTLVTKWVHAPHFAGLSKEGSMQVYVNAGTGTWGPPIRMGTTPELTLMTLKSV